MLFPPFSAVFHSIQQQKTKRPLTSRDKIQYYTVHTFILAYIHYTYMYIGYIYAYTHVIATEVLRTSFQV